MTLARNLMLFCILFCLSLISFAEEIKSVEQLEQELARTQGEERLYALRALGDKIFRVNIKRQLAIANEGLELVKIYPEPIDEHYFLGVRGWAYMELGEMDKAKADFEQVLKVQEGWEYVKASYSGFRNMGEYYSKLGQHNTAREWYLKAREIALRVNDAEKIASSYNSLAGTYYYQAEYDDALKQYQAALKINEDNGFQRSAAIAHRNIAMILRQIRDHKGAVQNLQESLAILESLQFQPLINLLRMDLAREHMREKSWGKAEQLLIAARDYFSGQQNKERLRNAILDLSRVYYGQEKYEIAIQTNLESLTLAQELGNPRTTAIEHMMLALKYQKVENFNKQIEHAEEMAALVEKNKIAKLHNSYKIAAQGYSALGNYKKASELFEKYTTKTVEAVREREKLNIKEIETKYQSEKKEQQIKLLESEKQLQAANLKQQALEIENQKAERNTWIAILGFLLMASIFLFYRQVQKKKLASQQAAMNAALLTKKAELFAHVSHEFRTPLTMVLGPVNQVLKSTKNADIKKAMSMVSVNAKRLLRMVDQLLDLARIDNVEEEYTQTIDLASVVKQTYDSLYSLFENKSINVVLINTNTGKNQAIPVKISVDAAEKVLVNLMSNSVKYTPENGSVNIECTTRGNEAIFSIKDSGIGIAPDQQQRVFERFVRVYDEKTENVPGAGIGLALVKELVERFGGRVELVSELNQGSKFTVTFPLAAEFEQKPEASEIKPDIIEQEKEVMLESVMPVITVEEKSDHQAPETNPKHILIVDDHQDMRTFIGDCLKGEYQCSFAKDGEEGIKMALELVPDLIVTDLMMPKKNGYEVTRILRDDIKTSHIPIVMLTAKGDDESRLEAWKTDVDDYMEKPFNQEELLLRIRNLLNIRYLMSQRLGLDSQNDSDSYEQKENTRLAGLTQKDKDFIVKLEQLVSEQYQNTKLPPKLIYTKLAMSERQFNRKMKALLSQTFTDYLRTYRLKMGAQMLTQGLPVTQVALDCGFSTQNYFSQCFKAQYGLAPSQYKGTD